ncbi:MAG TPA: hypothetical protein VGN09_20780 [Vicinamibacteria bacterium]|jgi:hypothetical protein
MAGLLRRLLRPWRTVEWLVLRGGLFPRRFVPRPGHFPPWVRLEARLFGVLTIGQLDIIAVAGQQRRLLRLALPPSPLWRRMAAESLAEALAGCPYAAWPRLWEAGPTDPGRPPATSDRRSLVLACAEHE